MKKILGFFLVFIFSINSIFANLYFSKILPNTTDDANLEYIEIYNSGNEKIILDNYKIKDKSQKEFDFGYGDFIDGNSYKKYYRTQTKILLNNTDEGLFLYDNLGNLIDSFSYKTSEKGKIISRENTKKEEDTNNNENNNTEEKTNNNLNEEKIKINFSFQNPSYILDKTENKNKYICDISKDECKINLDLRNSFSNNLKESDFNCEIDFGLKGWKNGQENKCNPSTIIFPKGTFEIKIKISSKNNPNNFDTKSFILENPIKKEITEKIIYKKDSRQKVDIKNLNIDIPKIEIQSGIKNGFCTKKDCKINLKYTPKNSKEKCLWNFGNGTFKTKNTDKKCNPGYVSYPKGNHQVILKVYEKNNPSNYKISHLFFQSFNKNIKNINNNKINLIKKEDNQAFKKQNEEIKTQNDKVDIVDINIDKQNLKTKNNTSNKIKNIVDNEINKNFLKKLNFKVKYFTDDIIFDEKEKLKNIKIEVQGKIGKNKILKNNEITCIGDCSINFNSSISNLKNINKIVWDFGNGETYDGLNPSYIKYEKYGDYKVSLNIFTKSGEKIQKFFLVKHIKKLSKSKISKIKKDSNKNLNTSKTKELKSFLIASKENCKKFIPTTNKDYNKLKFFIYFLFFIIFILMGIIIMQKRKIL